MEKVLTTDTSILMVEPAAVEKGHSKTLLLQQWLEKPEASWKVRVDALSKAPHPGPHIPKRIVTTHKQLV